MRWWQAIRELNWKARKPGVLVGMGYSSGKCSAKSSASLLDRRAEFFKRTDLPIAIGSKIT